jgi:hypothetical protein
MAEQEIFGQFKSHWDDDNDWNPGETGSGEDTHTFTVPAGKHFTRYHLSIEANTMGSSASVVAAPQAGATGQQTAKVSWHYNPFGKIAYTLRAYADDQAAPPPVVDIWVDTPNWERTAFDSIRQRKKVRLLLRGPNAKKFIELIRAAKGLLPLPPTEQRYSIQFAVAWDDVLIAAIVAAAVVAVVTLIVILVICVYAMDRNYYVKIDYDRKGPYPFDDSLEITLEPR